MEGGVKFFSSPSLRTGRGKASRGKAGRGKVGRTNHDRGKDVVQLKIPKVFSKYGGPLKVLR